MEVLNQTEKQQLISCLKTAGIVKVSSELFFTILCMNEALEELYEVYHWTSKGNDSYENHLLFERLYNSVDDEEDEIAEKFIGLFQVCFSATELFQQAINYVNKWETTSNCKFCNALNAEKEFVATVTECYELMKSEGTVTLGVDDFLPSLVSNHETNIYLLQQRDCCGSKKQI